MPKKQKINKYDIKNDNDQLKSILMLFNKKNNHDLHVTLFNSWKQKDNKMYLNILNDRKWKVFNTYRYVFIYFLN